MLKEVSRTTPYRDCARSAQRDVLSVLHLRARMRVGAATYNFFSELVSRPKWIALLWCVGDAWSCGVYAPHSQ